MGYDYNQILDFIKLFTIWRYLNSNEDIKSYDIDSNKYWRSSYNYLMMLPHKYMPNYKINKNDTVNTNFFKFEIYLFFPYP